MRSRSAIIGLLVAVATLVASTASADDSQRAKELFKEGLEAMMAGDHAGGCPKIEQAYGLTRGSGALFTVAECHAQWGKPATALKHYRAYLTVYAKLAPEVRKRQEERAKLAATQVAALSAVVPTLRIVLPYDQRERSMVSVDGKLVPKGALDGPLQLEVGEHVVEVTAADGRTVEQTFNLVEGAQRRWEVKLESPTKPVDPKPAPAQDEWTSTQIAGFVIGGTGLAVLAVGAVTGGLAVSERATVDERCTDLICDQEGLDAADSGRTLGDVSSATLVIGGAALVTGVVLLLAGGDDASTEGATQLTPSGLRWRF